LIRFYFALAVLGLMGAHESIVAALGANVVGFSMPPVLVFGLVALSPFLMLLANGMPSLFSLLPTASSTGLTAPPLSVTDAVLAGVTHATENRAAAAAVAVLTAPAPVPVTPPAVPPTA